MTVCRFSGSARLFAFRSWSLALLLYRVWGFGLRTQERVPWLVSQVPQKNRPLYQTPIHTTWKRLRLGMGPADLVLFEVVTSGGAGPVLRAGFRI